MTTAIDTRTVGQRAYDAWCQMAAGLDASGALLPCWAALDPAQRARWEMLGTPPARGAGLKYFLPRPLKRTVLPAA